MLRRLKELSLTAGVGWLIATAAVDAVGQNAFSPGGPDYKIVGSLIGDQVWPDAVGNTNGGWLVWQDNGADGSGFGIRAVKLNMSFVPTGQYFRVNQLTNHDQEKPKVALLPDGGAVVVWQGGRRGAERIYARFINSNATFRTGDILVNTYTNEFQTDPAVAVLADGSVLVVWNSYGQDGDLLGIYGQRLSSTGQKLGPEFQVNQFNSNNQRSPSLATLADGRIVAVWVSELQRYAVNATVDIMGRIYTLGSSGVVPLTDEFLVSQDAVCLCANPCVAPGQDGGFIVTWSQNESRTLTLGSASGTGTRVRSDATSLSTNSWDVFARIYGPDLIPTSPPFRVNAYTQGRQYLPRARAFGQNYLVVWTSLGQDGSREGIFGQFVTIKGGLIGTEFRVNTSTASQQFHPVIATDGASRFVVVWSQFQAVTGFDLFARVYDLIRLRMTPVAGGVQLSWNTYPGGVYQVQMSLNAINWTNYGQPRLATGFTDSVILQPTNNTGLFRVIRVQ
ncbi:MAG: hypothetical protein RMH97_05790 [Verrucomicrobiales bacterium]|nr:hypothetical protein [Verrucomicrobiales bacterium]